MTTRKKYTEEIHAKRLLKILSKPNPCMCCPAAPRYSSRDCPCTLWSDDDDYDPCDVCRAFVGLSPDNWNCPCQEFDREPDKGLKYTWLALEAKGYLD